jgi:hypothetical protein
MWVTGHGQQFWNANEEQGEDKPGNLVFNCTTSERMELITGSHYKCRKSYITMEIVKRYDLRADRFPNSIRLVWKEGSNAIGGKKTKSTRFWFTDDSKIECDVAIGTDYNKPDPPTNELEGEDQSENSDEDDSESHSAQESDDDSDCAELGPEDDHDGSVASSGNDSTTEAVSDGVNRRRSKRIHSTSQRKCAHHKC